MFNFEKLEVWRKSIDFADLVYRSTQAFPIEERFGITNQMRRASVSISSNIAEGTSRSSKPDYSRFVNWRQARSMKLFLRRTLLFGKLTSATRIFSRCMPALKN